MSHTSTLPQLAVSMVTVPPGVLSQRFAASARTAGEHGTSPASELPQPAVDPFTDLNPDTALATEARSLDRSAATAVCAVSLSAWIGHDVGLQAPVSHSTVTAQSQHSHSAQSQHRVQSQSQHSTIMTPDCTHYSAQSQHSHSTVTAQSQRTVTAQHNHDAGLHALLSIQQAAMAPSTT